MSMFIIVLTGGLGSGKTTAAARFRDRGAVVIDLDEVASRLLDRGTPLLGRVAERFGDQVLRSDGSLAREALASVAFASPEETEALNAIVHPAVAREVGEALKELRLMPTQPEVVVLEVPLLAEAPVFAEMADVVLAVSAPEAERVARAMARGMSEAEARARLAVQGSDEQRAVLADSVIVNDGDAAAFSEALDEFWEHYVALDGPSADGA